MRLYADLKAQKHPALSALPAYYASEDYWQEHAIVTCDGGSSYWGVEYDPETHQFLNESENGIG